MLPELQQYYEDRLSMMTTQAWSQLLEDLLEMRTQYENIRNCDAVADVLVLGTRTSATAMQ